MLLSPGKKLRDQERARAPARKDFRSRRTHVSGSIESRHNHLRTCGPPRRSISYHMRSAITVPPSARLPPATGSGGRSCQGAGTEQKRLSRYRWHELSMNIPPKKAGYPYMNEGVQTFHVTLLGKFCNDPGAVDGGQLYSVIGDEPPSMLVGSVALTFSQAQIGEDSLVAKWIKGMVGWDGIGPADTRIFGHHRSVTPRLGHVDLLVFVVTRSLRGVDLAW